MLSMHPSSKIHYDTMISGTAHSDVLTSLPVLKCNFLGLLELLHDLAL